MVSINGNEISLKVIEMPAMDRNINQGQQVQEQRQNQDKSEVQGEEQNQEQLKQQGQQDRKRQPGDRQIPQRELKFTGETKNITVSEGTPITSMTRGQNGIETKQLELKDIEQGQVLQIWYSDKEKEQVSRISVSSFGNRQN